MRHATVYIDPTALQHNLQRVRQLAPQAKVMCMVKANAYGIGLQHAIHAFEQADAFGVACMEEALQIRNFGSDKAITLIEGVFCAEEMPVAIQHHLECVIHHQQQLDWLLQHKTQYQQAKLKVWVKLNSGMNRLGFKTEHAIMAIQQLQQQGFHCILTMHFANADVAEHPLNTKQIEQLMHVKTACAPIELSCCNSAAIYNYPELHFDYVRPGIMLYGASPFAQRNIHELGLKTVMQFQAKVIAIHPIKAGEQVGYGSQFTAAQDMTIAVVSIGYGDGYPRAALQDNFVSIHYQLAQVIGRVSMDMITVDISHLENVTIGTIVELWGEHRLVDDVATAYGTISYELLCRLTTRPQRVLL